MFKIYKLFEQSLLNDFLLCWMHLVQLLNKVFLGDLIEPLLSNLYLLEWREGLIEAVGLAESVIIGLLQLLYY